MSQLVLMLALLGPLLAQLIPMLALLGSLLARLVPLLAQLVTQNNVCSSTPISKSPLSAIILSDPFF